MSRFDGISDFLKSGPRRLKDARELLELPTADPQRSDAGTRHLRGAMYLAGYGVECMLKAFLIDLEGEQSLTQAQAKMNARRETRGGEPIRNIASSAVGHSLTYLLSLTDLPVQVGYDPKVWGVVAKWDSSWRYDSTQPEREDAEEFVHAARVAMDWLRPKIVWRTNP